MSKKNIFIVYWKVIEAYWLYFTEVNCKRANVFRIYILNPLFSSDCLKKEKKMSRSFWLHSYQGNPGYLKVEMKLLPKAMFHFFNVVDNCKKGSNL